jgi:hypothetical protein
MWSLLSVEALCWPLHWTWLSLSTPCTFPIPFFLSSPSFFPSFFLKGSLSLSLWIYPTPLLGSDRSYIGTQEWHNSPMSPSTRRKELKLWLVSETPSPTPTHTQARTHTPFGPYNLIHVWPISLSDSMFLDWGIHVVSGLTPLSQTHLAYTHTHTHHAPPGHQWCHAVCVCVLCQSPVTTHLWGVLFRLISKGAKTGLDYCILKLLELSDANQIETIRIV